MPKRLFVFLLIFTLLLSGCSSSSGRSSSAPADETSVSNDVLTYIKEHVESALTGYDVDSITVLDQKGKVTVTASLKNGLSGVDFPAFCELASSSTLEVVSEKEVELGELTVITKAESGSMINWKSKDGSSGTLVDNRDGKNGLWSGVGLDEIEDKLNNR
nr:MAG TPA: 17 kDa common-antigen outer membrane protein [Caudoviricetes sp.]